MSSASLTPRVFAASLVAALAASAVVPSASLAQEPSDGLRAVPSALLTIDQNRSTVVERIVTEWGRDLAASSAGISIEQLRSMLHGMRADYLLAATVSGSLEGLRSVIAGSLIGTAPVKREATKALGDAERDVVYTPVTPCRVLDTRYGTVPPYNNVPMVGGTVLPVAVNLGSYVTQGGSATDCNLPTGVRAAETITTSRLVSMFFSFYFEIINPIIIPSKAPPVKYAGFSHQLPFSIVFSITVSFSSRTESGFLLTSNEK